jgi:hypothetical protein
LESVKKVAWLAVVLVALAVVALSAAAIPRQRVSAHLTTRVAIPKPVGTKKAIGAFTGSYVMQGNAVKLTWKLSFARLTGRATGATLRKGEPGLIGTQITVLCKPCTSGKGATTLMRKSVAKAIRAGDAYVVVYTKRNAAGEIRGQIRIKRR